MKHKKIIEKESGMMKWNLFVGIAMFVSVLLILGFSRILMIEGACSQGRDITYNYSLEEEQNLELYKTLVALSAEYVGTYAEAEENPQEVAKWVERYLEQLVVLTGNDFVTPYAAVNGQIIAGKPWSGEQFDYTKQKWYQEAIAADGGIVFTDAYQDKILNREVLTIAKMCADGKNVVAFDVFPENFRIHDNSQRLPEGSEYYVSDTQGNMLYAESREKLGREEQIAHFQKLYQYRNVDPHLEGCEFYYDENGKRMMIYRDTLSNGWTSLFVLSYSDMSFEWYKVVLGYCLIIAIIAILLLVTWFQWNRGTSRMGHVHEIVHILGDLYYAFCQVDVNAQTYEVIKGDKHNLERKGDYEQLLASLKDVIVEEDYKEFADSFSIENIRRQMEQDVKEFGGDFRRDFDGEIKWVNVKMLTAPLWQDKMILCFRVVEGEKQQQLKHMMLLKNALREAESSESSKQQFFFNMSHDMRTPLNVIIGMSELAKKHTGEPEKIKDYLGKINYSSKQLLNLINDILEISRLEQRTDLECVKFDLQECMENCISMFQMQADNGEKMLKLECTLQHKDVYGDRRHLEQILNNLLSNAIKFTEAGDSICVKVYDMDKKKGGIYQIAVTDTGAGMTEEFLENIFTPYAREKRFVSQRVEGTGLGMPIVKSMVTMMGGEITVESRISEGTTFTVTLPFDYAEEEQEKKTNEPVLETTEFSLEGKTVLLVEDYDLNMEVATEILEIQGAKVLQAWNGREAVEQFESSEEGSIDVILMDMQMPEMNGCEATVAIRKLARADAGTIPIIALTANVFSEDIARTTDAGMNAHISKPIDVKVLCNVLTEMTKGEKK